MTRIASRVIEVSAEVMRLRLLTEISRALTYTTSMDQVARVVVERGAELLGAPASVLMMAGTDDVMNVRAGHGIPEERLARFSAPLNDGVVDRLHGLFDVEEDHLIAVPLVVRGGVTGIIAVALSALPTEADEWLLSALADQASVALDAARLGGEVRLEMEGRLRVSEGATTAKDRALATLAHDIRSPLGAIDGYCWNLEEGLYGSVNERQRQALGRIRLSGRHLLGLLDSVLDMARLNAGVLPVATEPVACDAIAEETIAILTPAAAAKRQTLALAADPAPLLVRGNAARIRQVLVNLVGNAVKFTPEDGTITVTTRRHMGGDAACGLISVTDTGPGIAEAERAAIFEPYYRSEDAQSVPGVGLGLAISHALVKQMGGSIDVQSVIGSGATFSICLPLYEAGGGGTAPDA